MIDSGANLATAVLLKVLEMPAETRLPLPTALVYAYPALDFNYSSWMTPQSIAVLKQAESSVNLKGIAEQKDHFSHRSPLAIIDDKQPRRKRSKSWSKSFSRLPLIGSKSSSSRPRSEPDSTPKTPGWAKQLPKYTMEPSEMEGQAQQQVDSDEEEREEDKSMESRVKYPSVEVRQDLQAQTPLQETTMESRLTMTSRTAW